MTAIDYRWDYYGGRADVGFSVRRHVSLPDARLLPTELAAPLKAFLDARTEFEKARKAFSKAQDEPKRLLDVARDDARSAGHKGAKVDSKKLQKAIRAAEDALAEREFDWVAAEARLDAAYDALIGAAIAVSPAWKAQTAEQVKADVSRLNTARQMATEAAEAVATHAGILGMLHDLAVSRDLVMKPVTRDPQTGKRLVQPSIEASIAAEHLVAAIQAAGTLAKVASTAGGDRDPDRDDEYDEAAAEGWVDDDDG